MGRAGRKTHDVEQRLVSLANKSLKWCDDNFSKLTKTEKITIVTKIGAKYVPQKLEHSGLNFAEYLKLIAQNDNGNRIPSFN